MAQPDTSEPPRSEDEHKPMRLLSPVPIAAVMLSSLGWALLPYVFVGMLSMLFLPVALGLGLRVALAAHPVRSEMPGPGILLFIGLVLLALATPHTALHAVGQYRPEVWSSSAAMLAVWGFLSVVAPTLIAIGMRARSKLDGDRAVELWLYWFSYIPAGVVAALWFASLGWGTKA